MSTTPTDPDDRIHFVRRHRGPNVFPNFYFFSRLVRLSYNKELVAVKDLTFGYTASYAQLLTDVLNLRNVLLSGFSPEVVAKLDRDEEVFVNLLGPAGYEFTVAFLALIALGAVTVPISPDLPVKEASYFATRSRAVAVITAKRSITLGQNLEQWMQDTGQSQYRSISITPHIMQPCLDPEQFQVSSDPYLDLNRSGLVIFTSGTTGPPKGGVKRRGFLIDVALSFGDQHGIRQGDVVLHVLPVHHATGITVTLLPFLWYGGQIEFRSGGLDVPWTWERIRQGGLTYFSGVPTIYMRLMAYYEQHLFKLPPDQLEPYIKGANGFRALLCGTSALPRPLQQKWSRIRNGRPILTRYGGTEFANGFTVTPWATGVPDGSVGERAAGTDLYLSNGDEGEILTRSPIMYSKYLYDREATKNSMDENGYFKTGDIARREGKHYFILGRASIDIIKSGGYKLSALDIEREILGLDYVSEVMIVGVDDEEFGQRVAAAIVLKPEGPKTLTLEKLRHDLKDSLAGYKMPTLLRIVAELKKNATGKVMKKVLVKELFPSEGSSEVQAWISRKTKGKL
ncbi:putative AMP-binding enzyme [Exophiala viscosa]|uniref:AMP-binding enzyme n=1 Tax=Exophiala viscosa TaxID=2486360 RepID=A0AAN6DUQ6_9EURO|nr:putative AMP-binding enzyme [Exophiala viscosa]